jgi:ABC-2 type transport system permease protein
MFRTLYFREMQSHLLSHRFYVCLLATVVTVMLTVLLLGQQQGRHWSEFREATSAQQAFLDRYAHANRLEPMIKPLLPPARLGALFSGPRGAQSLDTIYTDPLEGFFAPPDLIFVVAILLSLFAVILSYDGVCGEREQGTLRLMLTYPIGRAKVLMAKLVAGFTVMASSLLIAMLVGVLFGLVTGNLDLTGRDWRALLTVFVGALLYLQGFYTLGLFISASTRDSGNAVFGGLLAWGFLVLLVPAVAPSLAERMLPAPSPHLIEAKVKQLDAQREIDLRAIRQRLATENLGAEDFNARFEPEVARVNKAHATSVNQLREPFEARVQEQAALGWILAAVSPYANFVAYSSAAAAAGVHRQSSFRQQAVAFHRLFSDFVRPRIDAVKRAFPGDYLDRHLDLGDRPTFQFQESTLSLRLGRLGIFNLVMLLFFSQLFFAAAFVRFLRYDPR